MPVADKQLTSATGGTYHACAFFSSPDEEYPVMGPLVEEGLALGARAVHIVDPGLRQDHLERLAAAGVEVAARQASGQLEVLPWSDAYLRDGRFDADAMLAQLVEVLEDARARGYDATRIVGHMEWALEDRPGVAAVLEYEARVNDVVARYRQPAICVYDLTRFGAAMMMDVLRTHPLVIVGGTLYENPFFVPPATFLAELERRRAS